MKPTVEQPDGWRTLLAPSAAVADFVAPTYVFDEVVIGPVALVAMKGSEPGVRAQRGRTEFYGPHDVRVVESVSGSWRGTALGELADVQPPVRFGFGSTPARPAVTSLVTTVVSPKPAQPQAAADHEQ